MFVIENLFLNNTIKLLKSDKGGCIMICANHPDREAVAKCVECGAFLCRECVEKTKELKETCGTLCPDCYKKELEKGRDFYKTRAAKSLGYALVMTVFYLIGVILIAVVNNSSLESGYILLFIGFLLCGLFGAIAGWKLADRSLRESEAKHGATYVITDTGVQKESNTWLKIIFFIFGLVFGIFMTPINIIRYFIRTAKDKKTAKQFDLEIQAI